MENVLPQAFRGRTDRLDRRRVSFMAGLHLAALATLVRATHQPLAWPTVALAVTWLLCSGLSITGGYHRLFAHRSYRCSRTVAAFYLLFGAAAVQNSALSWASAHRRHHAHTDQDEDPYDARRGLWWSHIGWLLHSRSVHDCSNVPDLSRDRLVVWQHRLYTPLAIAMAGVVPVLIASAWRDPLGGFLWAVCMRLVVQYHGTFAINSVAHRFGSRPYSTATSARDNPLLAVLTLGEGYHNFHHRFPSDYRNGVRRLDLDATKWFIRALALARLATDLKRAAPQAVVRARQGCQPES
jgi:stearoyl-CoA desaturase (Delta-9 desaturase)